MGVKTPYQIKRSNAIIMIREKGLQVYENDCVERLEDMIEELSEYEFEKYDVIEDNEDYISYYRTGWEEWEKSE